MTQPYISNANIWLMTLSYMFISIVQDPRLLDRIPTLMAVNIIKHILREINTLPADLTTMQVDCLNKGKEMINLLLLGPHGDGAGVVSHYDIIVAVSVGDQKEKETMKTNLIFFFLVTRCVWTLFERQFCSEYSLGYGEIHQ